MFRHPGAGSNRFLLRPCTLLDYLFPKMVQVSLYGKADCHLCDEAKAVLEAARNELAFDLEVVDITRDPALFERYRYDIPVVHVNGRKAFKHRLDPAAVLSRLRRATGEPT